MLMSSIIPIPLFLTNFVFQLIPYLVFVLGLWDRFTDYFQSRYISSDFSNEYDFIIVGAGSAGSLLANRLSENGNYIVLLLEAGGGQHFIQRIPAMFPAVLRSAEVDHGYFTVPQYNACLALKQQRSYWPRGKGLGGTSNLNAMIYQRGNKNDYDRWAELSGDDGWKFENILRNFKNVEDYQGLYKTKWHSSDGRGVHVAPPSESKITKEFLKAAKEMGYPTEDVNGFRKASFSPAEVNIKNGQRFGAYSAFLKPVLEKENIKIKKYAQVLKVHFDENLKAKRVTYLHHGAKRVAMTKREIILSAGSIDTPKILQLSGIGPKRYLEKLQIETLVDLPVGKNLQDHVMVGLGPFVVKTSDLTINLERDLTLNSGIDYLANGKGVLATPTGISAVGYIYSSLALERIKKNNISAENVSPDIQLLLWALTPSLHSRQENQVNMKEGLLTKYYENSSFRDAFIVNVMVAKYKSRGYVKLRTSDPLDLPIINPRYFSHPDDIKVLVDGMNFTVTMTENSRAFRKHNAHLFHRHFPGCENFTFKSLPYYECLARHWTLTTYHPTGTCSMGKDPGDPKAVVDSRLRVLGTKGLRVVDASIIPEIPNSNTNAAVYMIADKAAEMILEDNAIL